MKRRTIAVIFILVLVHGVSFGAEQKDTSDWPDLFGMYSGKATVTSNLDLVIETKVQIQIRPGKRNLVILEMLYFEGKIAKFTKCKRIGKYKFQVYDLIDTKDQKVIVSGYIDSKDAKVFTGKIQYQIVKPNGQKNTLRIFDFTELRKTS